MIKLLDQGRGGRPRSSPDDQDDIARAVLRLDGQDDAEPVGFSTEKRAATAGSKAAAVHGEFATEDQIRATWARHGL